MLLGAEIGMLIYGIVVLVKGNFSLGKGREVTGTEARILGLLCFTPILAGIGLGAIWGFVRLVQGRPLEATAGLFVMELLLVVGSFLGILKLGHWFHRRQPAGPVASDRDVLTLQR